MLSKWKFNYLLSWLMVLLWMILIFSLSAEPSTQSNHLSTGVTDKVVELIEKVTGQTNFNIEDFNHVIRKCAHFSIYLVLGILVMNALRNGHKSIRFRVIAAMIICILYASSDEFHQIFVSGRGPQITDVFIDSCGAGLGIGIYVTVWRKWKMRVLPHMN